MNTKMLILLLIFALALPAMAVDLNGTWYTGSKDGTPYLSSTTSNSFTWGQGETPTSTTATTGALWSYFPDLTLAQPGDRITLDFSVIVNDAAEGGRDFRFGLFNDGGNRVLTNLPGNNADGGFLDTRGYFVRWSVDSTGNIYLYTRTSESGGATNPTSTSNAINLANSGGNPGVPVGITCDFTFSIAFVSETEYQVSATLDTGTDVKTITSTTTQTDTTTFNTFMLLNTLTEIGSMTFDDMKVVYNDWAWQPYPAPGAVDIELDPILSWSKGLDPNVPTQTNANITTHKLYGNFVDPTDPNLFLIAELPAGTTTYDLTTLVPNLQLETTYSWRVDEFLGSGPADPCIPGMVWTFDTILSTPSIIEQPQDMVVSVDEEALLAVDATNPFYGDATGLSYQWKYSPDDTTYSDVTGANSASLPLAAAQVSDQGYYYCDVTIVSNNQTLSSEVAQLIVKQTLAHWTMDQADFVNDQYLDIVGGHNADPNSPPTFVNGAGPDMPAAGAATIAPDSHAAVGMWNPLETTGQVTLSAWIKWDGSIGTYGNDILSKQDSWGTDTMMWSLKIRDIAANGNAGIWFYNFNDYGIRTSGLIPFDTWTHVCLAYGNGQAQLYINGELVATDGSAVLSTGTESQLTIGGNSKFPGALDNVMIHNYAMSADDAAKLYYETSKEAICLYPPVTDLNGDCKTDLMDFALVAESWLNCGLVPDCLP